MLSNNELRTVTSDVATGLFERGLAVKESKKKSKKGKIVNVYEHRQMSAAGNVQKG